MAGIALRMTLERPPDRGAAAQVSTDDIHCTTPNVMMIFSGLRYPWRGRR